jgi:hypothetical protein
MGGESAIVGVDAQFGMTKLLRPQPSFVADYQGQSSLIPIMFTELGEPRDPLASVVNYDPNLIKGLPVCVGQRCFIWLPKFGAVTVTGTTSEYVWRLVWRIRNLNDMNVGAGRGPAHNWKQGVGVRDTAVVPNADRVVILAATETVTYNPTEPTSLTAGVIVNARVQDVGMLGDEPFDGSTQNVLAPLIPALAGGGTVTGVVQQGVLDPTLWAPAATKWSWGVFETRAKGDELLIGLYRTTAAASTWGFVDGSTDEVVADALASPEIGPYVMMGSAP